MDYYSKPQFRGGILLSEISAPATPSNSAVLYAGTDGYLYSKNDAGNAYGFMPPPMQSNQAANTSLTSTTYAAFTGGPSLVVPVPASGRIELRYGFVGTMNSDVVNAQIYMDVKFSGANTKDPLDTETAVMMFGRGTNNDISVERAIVFEGLTPGDTTVDLYAHYYGSTSNTVRESWIIAQVLP